MNPCLCPSDGYCYCRPRYRWESYVPTMPTTDALKQAITTAYGIHGLNDDERTKVVEAELLKAGIRLQRR